MKVTRFFTLSAIAAFALVASTLPAAAQDAIRGSFKLSQEVKWQNATLPAGEYTFKMNSTSATTPVFINGPRGTIIELSHVNSVPASDRQSVLVLENHGGTLFVREMDLASLGVQIRYSIPKSARSETQLAKESASTERILIAMSTK
jgi:hypothetical protein